VISTALRSERVRWLCRAAFGPALFVVLVAAVIDTGPMPLPSGSDKLEHALAFLALGVLALAGFPRWSPFGKVLPGLAAYGALIEFIQWWLPWRECSLLDWAADLAGVLLACLLLRRITRAGGAPAERP
jgi:VanZ family protein